jgi:SnoaL-like domain
MSRHTLARTICSRFIGSLAVGVAALQLTLPAPTLAQQVTMETLLDRIQIEDLLVRYYYDLSMGRAHEMSEYFTEDAMLDVDGTIANGRAAIEIVWGWARTRREPAAQPYAADQSSHRDQRQ